jgi:hypothetical protein
VCAGGACAVCRAGETLCGGVCVACGAGTCGASISASMDGAPAGWTFNGSAHYDATAHTAVLTTASVDQVGTLWFGDAVIPDGMSASFRFRISGRGDGMAFALQQTGVTAAGMHGGGLGVAGLRGYGVEIDVYNNMACGDADNDHLAVDDLATCGSSGIPTTIQAGPALLGSIGVDLADNAWHQCAVQLTGGAMSVQLDGHAVLTGVALPGYVAGQTYFLGFGGATAGVGAQQEVRDVSITFPTSRCL